MPRAGLGIMHFFHYRRGGLYVMAGIIGVLAGLGAVAFRYGIHAWELLLTGHHDYTAALGVAEGKGKTILLFAPLISALIYAPLMCKFGYNPWGRGVAAVMMSVRHDGGRTAFVPSATTTASSALTIGGGGNVGPEGPISELGAAIGYGIASRFGAPSPTRRILAAAGVAAGVAAAFNAPLAGAFFAMEVILVDFTSETFVSVVIACVAATVTNKQFVGDSLSFTLNQDVALAKDTDLLLVAVLSVLGGIVGIAFSKARYGAEDLITKIWRGPVWLRPIIGGVVLGGVLWLVPGAYGEGDFILNQTLRGEILLKTVLLLLVVKFFATALTVAIGGVGGTFAPSLFLGGALGSAFGMVVEPSNPQAVAIFGMLGMGAVFTGAARAPMTGVLLIMELTGQFHLLLPLMVVVVVATGTSRVLSDTTIYTEAIVRHDAAQRARAVASTVVSTVPEVPGAAATTNSVEASQHGGASVMVVDEHREHSESFEYREHHESFEPREHREHREFGESGESGGQWLPGEQGERR